MIQDLENIIKIHVKCQEEKDKKQYSCCFTEKTLTKFLNAINKCFMRMNKTLTLTSLENFIFTNTIFLYYNMKGDENINILENGWEKKQYDIQFNKKFGPGEYFTYVPETYAPTYIYSLVILPDFNGVSNVTKMFADEYKEKCYFIVENTDDENYAIAICK